MAEKDIQLAEKDAKITALEDENSRLKGMPQKKAHTDQGKNTLQKPDKQAEDNPPTSPQIKSLENKMSQLKKELDKEKNKNKQVSNAHTPPSQDSKAQNDLKKYREEHPNDQTSHNESSPKRNNSGKRLCDLEISQVVNTTVDSCTECQGKIDVKTITKDTVDIPEMPKAEKTRNIFSVGKCENGHHIQRSYQGVCLWPTHNEHDSILVLSNTQYRIHTQNAYTSRPKCLKIYRIKGNCHRIRRKVCYSCS